MTTATTTREQEVLQAVERLRPTIEHYRDQGEQERSLRTEVIDAMRSEGLFRLKLPRIYGGEEIALTPFVAAVIELARLDSAAGWTLANLASSGVLGAYFPEEAAKEIFAGDNLCVGAIIPRGRAVPVEGGFRVSGRWPLASGCHHADWAGGNCLVFEGEAPRMSPQGIPDMRMAFFRTNDIEILDTWYSSGMRGTDSTDFVVKDLFVPAERALSILTGQPRLPGAPYRLRIEAHFFTALSAVGLGIARSAIDRFVELARTKTPALSQTGLASRPTIHAAVARAEARLQSAAAYLRDVTVAIDAAVQMGPVPPELEARRRLACVTVSEACEEVVDSMFRLAGTSVIYQGSPLERNLRDVHTLNQHTAVSPVWWEKTGQFYFGQELGMP